ncbi:MULTISPECIES: hypothetical protein [unclassified Nocardiopsis]|uniref:hypothetical protein n=1 Tax=unclassified Nocardiopsis TaxID=2649073 RepID=UPI00135A335A|nr:MULTISPECIES: hypothetical protein [unclassified Nocardiopsis]
MIPVLFTALRQCLSDLRHTLTTKDTDDAGLGTLETAIIALGVMGLAIALVAAITAAVNSRLEGIQ